MPRIKLNANFASFTHPYVFPNLFDLLLQNAKGKFLLNLPIFVILFYALVMNRDWSFQASKWSVIIIIHTSLCAILCFPYHNFIRRADQINLQKVLISSLTLFSMFIRVHEINSNAFLNKLFDLFSVHKTSCND